MNSPAQPVLTIRSHRSEANFAPGRGSFSTSDATRAQSACAR
jgi:hypothetical protein